MSDLSTVLTRKARILTTNASPREGARDKRPWGIYVIDKVQVIFEEAFERIKKEANLPQA